MGRIKPEKLKAGQLTSYIQWLQTPSKQHTVGVGNGKAKSPTEILYIIPFNVQTPANFYVKTSGSQAAYTANSTKFQGYLVNSLPANNAAERLSQFSAARIVHKTGKQAKGTAKTSHITGSSYNNYGGTSLSLPFGKTSQTVEETELQDFEIIRGKFGTNGVLQSTETVTLVKEKFTERSQ